MKKPEEVMHLSVLVSDEGVERHVGAVHLPAGEVWDLVHEITRRLWDEGKFVLVRPYVGELPKSPKPIAPRRKKP